MRGLVTAVFLAALFSEAVSACGTERALIKTGGDVAAEQIAVCAPLPTTIAEMRRWPKPVDIPQYSRIYPYETTVWTAIATLYKYKLEGDQDYHLVLEDDVGNTIIAEMPDLACVDPQSSFISDIANARLEFERHYRATPTLKKANVKVRITGVGMFDFLHGQAGVAPNGIELHPVTEIVFEESLP